MFLDDIGDLLETAGLGAVGAVIFSPDMPDRPDHAVQLRGYPGEPPEFDHDSPLPALRYPRFQVLVRDRDYAAARLTAEAIYLALCGVVNQTINGRHYLRVEALGEPSPLPRDQSNRALVVTNYRVTY